MRAGCSIRLSTPPSDSASWKMLRARDELDRLLLGLDEERDHPAEVAHLRARDLVARGATRGPGRARARPPAWPSRNSATRRAFSQCCAHPHGERLEPAQHEPRVERAGHGAERLLQEVEALGERVVVRRDEAADRRRCGRRGTSSSSGRRGRRRARAAAAGTASRTCCRRRAARRPRARRRPPCGCRRRSAAGSTASRPTRASRRRRGARRGCRRTRRAGTYVKR